MKTDFKVEEERSSKSHWSTLKTLLQHLWPKDRVDLKIRVIIALIFLIAAKAMNVSVPFLLKSAIDRISTDSIEVQLVLGLVLAYGLARLTVVVFGEIRDLVFENVSQHALRTISLSTFRHMHNLSLDFHLSRKTGGLSRVIERGSRAIQFSLRFMTFNIVPTLLELAMVTGILFFQFNWIYAAIVFGTIALYIAATLWVTEWRLQFRRKMNKEESQANTKAIDSLLNYETVKYFGNESHEYNRFDQNLARYEKAAIRSQLSLSLINVVQGGIIAAGLIAVMSLSAMAVARGENTIGDFVLVNSFLIQLYLPLGFLGFVYREIKQSLIDMDKMFELISVERQVDDKPNAAELKFQAGEVEFQDVRFSYNPDREILKGVSFKVPAGKTTAIVGPSGSGKSTISRLLFRFYDVNQGAVLIDGQDIRDVKQDSVRAMIGIVPQDTVLFNDTIGYNIGYGRPDATAKDIETAAQLAKIDGFIDTLPDKLDTEVGERGLKLSGGEKQRVAIARTILKTPKIMMFDEATSALDSATEKEIQNSLNEVSKDRTTLIIAHRLSTIVGADEIIVLKDGEIVERGRHESLLSENGEYASMWNKQQQAQEYESKLKECTQ